MPLYELDGARVQVPVSGRFWIAPSATVIGRVTIGEDVTVWFNTVIRGDNEPIRIGARTSIQEGVVLHGCTIGKGALIGIGAIVLNGAKIGEGAMIGAGALIPEGKEIPPNTVVLGSPGKVVREVTPKDRARILEGVEDYVMKGRKYARGLKPQI